MRLASGLTRTGLYFGRRKPYTAIGIRRVPCARCGKPSTQQWQICANGNRFLGVCGLCDVLLNQRTFDFFRLVNPRGIQELMQRYERRIAE